MSIGPTCIRPSSPLGEYVESIGDWRTREADYWSRALPRGAVTVIFDVGQRQQLDFYAADAKTRLSVLPAFITGSHTASYVSNIPANEPVMAVHFRPGGALPFLGIPLGDLENAYVGIEEVWGSDGRRLHERLIETSSAPARFEILEQFLLSRPSLTVDRHPGVAEAIAAIESDPSIRMADIRHRVGMATKRLVALFRAEVGLSPKAYARVAAEVGYFDQAHFVRDFESFTGLTPTQYSRQPIVLPSHVPIERHKFIRPLIKSSS